MVDGTRLEQLERGVTVDLGRAALAARRYHVPSAVTRTASAASEGGNLIGCDWGTDAQALMPVRGDTHDV